MQAVTDPGLCSAGEGDILAIHSDNKSFRLGFPVGKGECIKMSYAIRMKVIRLLWVVPVGEWR